MINVFVSPQELESFKAFVRMKPAFDVVVDGLNVANINKDRSKQSEMVRTHKTKNFMHGKPFSFHKHSFTIFGGISILGAFFCRSHND